MEKSYATMDGLVHFAIPKLAKITATSEEFATMAPVYAKAMNFMEIHAKKNFARMTVMQMEFATMMVFAIAK